MTDRKLMQMALDALNNFDKGNHGMRWQVPVIKALRAALAQPEQEEGYDAIANKQLASLKAAAKVTFEDAVVRAVHKLYNAPPQREWQGLTDDEIIDAANMAPFETMVSAEDYIYIIARAIEQALKEKNT